MTAKETFASDMAVEGDLPSLRTVAGVMALIAYATNWQALHPFHYRVGDYAMARESELPPTVPIKIKINHRYGDFELVQRTMAAERRDRFVDGLMQGTKTHDDARGGIVVDTVVSACADKAATAEDPVAKGKLFLIALKLKGEKPSITALAAHLGLKRNSLYESKQFASLRQFAEEHFGLFRSEGSKENWAGAHGSKSNGRMEAWDNA